MGARNPDRISFAAYAAQCPTVGRMVENRWDVFARCNACGLTMQARLGDIVKLRGPDFRLWGVESPCRDLKCLHGRMRFYGRPRGYSTYYPLSVENDPARHTRAVEPAPEPLEPREHPAFLTGSGR